MLQKVEKGSAISTVYSAIEADFGSSNVVEVDTTATISTNTIYNVEAASESVVVETNESGSGGSSGKINSGTFPFAPAYTITLKNVDEDSCTITATRSGATETATLAENETMVLAKKITANKSIDNVYSSIIADYNGTEIEVDVTAVITESTLVEITKGENTEE